MFRPITISAVLNGWIVTCGCQTVVYQDRNQLTSDLDAYLRDPEATEARFLQTGVNKMHTNGGPVAVQAAESREFLARRLNRDAAADGGGTGSSPTPPTRGNG